MCPIAARPLIADRYRREALIATGGMGEVWRGTDEILGRPVAVKVLRAEYAADPDFRERFRAEARAAAAVNDPAVVEVYDYGESESDDGWLSYLVMEYVAGESLADRLRRHTVLTPSEVVAVLAATAQGLAAAHRCGLVHRDIKPANLLRTPDGAIKIADFGIARAADAVALTRTGTILGTAHYLSPEQAAGRSATAASDLYSLGAVAYACLAGSPPFTADSDIAVAMAHLNAEPPPLPASVPPDLRDLVMRLLARDPEDRVPSADALVVALAAVDLAGADQAVPAGAGLAAAAAPTVAAPRAAGPAPTRALPAPEPLPESAAAPLLTSRRILWSLAAIAVIVGIAVAIGSSGSGPPSRASLNPAKTTPTAHAAKHISRVDVSASDYLGRPVSDVKAALHALGLKTSTVTVSSAAPAGTVLGLSPTGRIKSRQLVVLTVSSTPQPPAPAPKVPPGHQPGHGGHGPGKGHGHGED